MTTQKIVPCIWFTVDHGRLEPVLNYYKTIFKQQFRHESIVSLGQTPSGYAELCHVYLFEQEFSFMTTALQHHPLNDAISMMIRCKNQEEIDEYWSYFTVEGFESQCGWCSDKYGLRWQIIPHNIAELMQTPNAFQVMMGQTKIIINEYLH